MDKKNEIYTKCEEVTLYSVNLFKGFDKDKGIESITQSNQHVFKTKFDATKWGQSMHESKKCNAYGITPVQVLRTQSGEFRKVEKRVHDDVGVSELGNIYLIGEFISVNK